VGPAGSSVAAKEAWKKLGNYTEDYQKLRDEDLQALAVCAYQPEFALDLAAYDCLCEVRDRQMQEFKDWLKQEVEQTSKLAARSSCS